VRGHLLQLAREAAARIVTVLGASTGVLTFAAALRQEGALAPSPRTRDDSAVSIQCLSSRPCSCRYDFELLCDARRPSQRGMGNTNVPAALKHLPALDPNPTLSRSPPLCCGQELFIKDYSCTPVSPRALLRVDRLGKGLGSG